MIVPLFLCCWLTVTIRAIRMIEFQYSSRHETENFPASFAPCLPILNPPREERLRARHGRDSHNLPPPPPPPGVLAAAEARPNVDKGGAGVGVGGGWQAGVVGVGVGVGAGVWGSSSEAGGPKKGGGPGPGVPPQPEVCSLKFGGMPSLPRILSDACPFLEVAIVARKPFSYTGTGTRVRKAAIVPRTLNGSKSFISRCT